MAEQEDFIDLNWVRVEVTRALSEIKQSLDLYLENPADRKRLVFCRARLYQIQGSLTMLRQKGASLLAEELLAVTDALISGQTTNGQMAAETLLLGVIQLSVYAEDATQRIVVQSAELLSLLNIMRGLRHCQPLTGLDFFQPDYGDRIQPLDESQLDQFVQSGAIKLIRKIRHKYQVCLTSYLRQKEPEKSLVLMAKLFGKLQNLSWGSPSSSLWDASSAFVEGLREGSIKSSNLSNSLLKELDSQLKQLVESKGLEINQPPSEPFLKKILYLIAISQSDSHIIHALKKRYKLEVAIPLSFAEDELLNTKVSEKTPKSVSVKVKRDKDSSESPLVALDNLHKVALLESRDEIVQVKRAMTDYLDSKRNIEYLEKIPILLKSAYSTLNMDPLTTSAKIISKLVKHIELTWMIDGLLPSQEHLNRAIQGLTFLDDYFKHLLQGDVQQADLSFELAKKSLKSLEDIEAQSFFLQRESLAGMAFKDLQVIPHKKEKKNIKATLTKKKLSFEFAAQAGTAVEKVEPETVKEAVKDTLVAGDEESAEDQIAIFLGAISAVQQELSIKLACWVKQSSNNDALKAIHLSFHTLKNSARVSGANVIGELALASEGLVSQLLSGAVKPSNGIASLLRNIIAKLPDLAKDFASNNQLLTPEVLLLMEQADDLARGDEFFDSEELEGIKEAELAVIDTGGKAAEPAVELIPSSGTGVVLFSDIEVLLSADSYLKRWTEVISSKELKLFEKELKILSDRAVEATLEPLVLLCNVLTDVCQYLSHHEKCLPLPLLAPLRDGFDALVDILSQQAIVAPQSVFSQIKKSLESLLEDRRKRKNNKLLSGDKNTFEGIVQNKSTGNDSAQDKEIINLFLEEASDLLKSCAQAFDRWLYHDNSSGAVTEIQRYLHTLKGGARMAEFEEIGNLCHALESVYEAIIIGRIESSEVPLDLMKKAHNFVDAMIQMISSGAASPSAQHLVVQLECWSEKVNHSSGSTGDVSYSAQPLPDYLGRTSSIGPLSSLVSKTIKDIDVLPERVPEREHENYADVNMAVPLRSKVTDVPLHSTLADAKARVTNDIIEQMVNLTDETSIHHSQIEQQVQDIASNLSEMDSTILRLREQLRHLKIQTTSTNEEVVKQKSVPAGLEVNQDSELKQLFNGLMESASDLADLHQSLEGKSRATGALLLHQSRTQSRLQTQLLQLHLVSFKHLIPRFQKTVSQLSKELCKPVELTIKNAGVKIDRAILDKVVAPIEHILRNSIIHGVEGDSKSRVEAGKPATGQLLLELSCKGAYITIKITDDGRGFDFRAIRDKAIEKDLISSAVQPDKKTLLKLIMTAGFSTAHEVTQTAGRGMGLDVVNDEVRKLGGSVQIESKSRQGTCFSLQLPLRSSVSQALMVGEGGNLYAFPMQLIDGLITLSLEEVLDGYKGKAIEYAGIKHRLISFGRLLGLPPTSIQSEQCPVIITQRGGDNVALHVDTVFAGREFIIQSLGLQFKDVTSVIGTTVLGDGQVVILIDPVEMIRKHSEQLSSRPESSELSSVASVQKIYRVLVVDDSITMRKVIGQLLALHGYHVDTARNGVESMNKISEKRPDLVLLDVDMPKMDGFEVASAIRSSSALKNLPIVMVTSRTGVKCHNRAQALGINEYISKPIQEVELIKTIKTLILTASSGG
ncbi:MAG: response regulator [Candidatus Endonucleobacter sp. (ex Gigantidas childressi)]|nr:response regulator [Candidatus Endonucleobacter sp. (ex Gigantidas childressi)]